MYWGIVGNRLTSGFHLFDWWFQTLLLEAALGRKIQEATARWGALLGLVLAELIFVEAGWIRHSAGLAPCQKGMQPGCLGPQKGG